MELGARRSHVVVTALVVLAMAVAGCGGSSGKSSSSSGKSSSSSAKTTPTPLKGGTAVTAPHFTATRPAGWDDITASQPPNTTTGLRPELTIKGPRAAGVSDIVDAAALSLNSHSDLRQVIAITRARHKANGDTLDPAGVTQRTVDGDKAYVYSFQVTTRGAPKHEQSVYVRHGKADFFFIFVASPGRYDRDLATFNGVLDSVHWTS